MGFRKDGYATVWEVKPVSDFNTRVRLSTVRKNRDTGEYEQDFSGFVRFVGSANAKSALGLKRKDHIKIGDCDVTTRYDKKTQKEYTNYTVFNFQMSDLGSSNGGGQSYDEPTQSDPQPSKALPF